jgi:catechol 2,3-dioxygenase-like lactoylglutathione lyase family enzyme
MQVRSLAWLGVRTEQFAAMRQFFTEVMGLETTREEPGLLGLRLAEGTEMELFGPGDDFHDFFTTGPVVAFLVDDVDNARATMEAAGIEFIGEIQRAGTTSWNHFRAPDGTIFEIISRGER